LIILIMTSTESADMKNFPVYVERGKETGLYIGVVPGIPGAHTQAATPDELQKNLKEVIELCLEENQKPA